MQECALEERLKEEHLKSLLIVMATQLSQLRLVGISSTISQVSFLSSYASIVSWYLNIKVMSHFPNIISIHTKVLY